MTFCVDRNMTFSVERHMAYSVDQQLINVAKKPLMREAFVILYS